MTSILHVASECFPLVKTGGLGDVVGVLPHALRALGEGLDARVALPAYGDLVRRLDARPIAELPLRGQFWGVFEAMLPVDGGQVPLYLFHCPPLLDRDDNPYRDATGHDYPDNAERFGGFCEAVAQFLWMDAAPFSPHVVHAHDWQSGPALAWLRTRAQRPKLVFTIHNLAYQGVFPAAAFFTSGLPGHVFTPEGAEYWGQYSFMKAGLTQADVITTVSPSYALEIQQPDYGCGLDGLLRHRADVLYGIVNGIDVEVWNPETDPLIAHRYNTRIVLTGKRSNRHALALQLGFDGSRPLVGFIGRMASQKGVDLILDAWPRLQELDASYVIVASGDAAMEARFQQVARSAPPGKIAVCMVHSEPLAHQVTAASDLILMPSRYEPCGLNQLYAQRYGAIPVVRKTGGLADTVVDATPATLADKSATGVHFDDPDPNAVVYGIARGLKLLADRSITGQLRRRGMGKDWSWTASARHYANLYAQLLA